MMAGLLFARAGVPGPRARKARRLLPRFPRRHGPPVDDGDPRPARACSSASSSGRTTGLDSAELRVGRARMDDRRPVAPRHAGAVHRDDAAMGVPRFPARRGGGLSRLSARHGAPSRRASSRRAGRVAGVRLDDGRELRAKLTIAADGRASIVRSSCFRSRTSARRWTSSGSACQRPTSRGGALRGNVEPGRMLVLIDRGDYWQCAFLIPKGAAEAYQGARHRRDPRARSQRPRRPSSISAEPRRRSATFTC